jgi:GTP-binding protein HflX
VIVRHATGLLLPDIGRLRAAEGRFRALRLVHHTHLFGEPLTRDDLIDLTRLRLDLVAAILINAESEPHSLTWASNVPSRDDQARPYQIVGPVPSSAGSAAAARPWDPTCERIQSRRRQAARLRAQLEVRLPHALRKA